MNIYIYLGILLTFIGILLTTFLSTLLSTIIGISLIFMGTILSTIVGIRSNKKENEKTLIEVEDKLAEFQSEIKSVKDASLSESVKEVVKKTEDQFNRWANKFVQKKDELVISQKKKMLTIEEEQLKQTTYWREYVLHFNKTLANFVNAINKKSESKLVFKEFTMPKNLFKWDKAHNFSEIRFRKDLFWLIKYEIDIEREYLVISISLKDESIEDVNEDFKDLWYGYEAVEIIYYREKTSINVTIRSTKLDSEELLQEYELEDYKSSIELIIEKIFELQLLEL